MGDLAADTAVEPNGDGRYTATPSKDWEIWGPNGGYMAALALRAAGCQSSHSHPASIACHYLARADFQPVEMQVTPLRATARAESLRVSMTQKGRAVLEALVWTIGELDGPQREWIQAGKVASPLDVPTVEEVAAAHNFPALPFWRNIEIRIITGPDPGSQEAQEPLVLAWNRFRPQATFDDPWIDACRATVLVDVHQFPAASRGFSRAELTFAAPSLDLYVAFHARAPQGDWLLSESRGLISRGGLLGGHACVWSRDGLLLASGGQQMLQRSFAS
jgi:acyl-CoA thioesterase II